jgi:hypothetical protein
MNFFQAIKRATALAIATAALAVQATPVRATANYDEMWEDHMVLVRTIQEHGVQVHVNYRTCGTEGMEHALGYYQGLKRLLVVCQEAGSNTGAHSTWSREDFDTLRHEAQHFIQDCRRGERHDHELWPMYRNPMAFARGILGPESVARILRAYGDRGASSEILILEVEAFAVAAQNDPIGQARDVIKYCGRKG